MGKPQYLYHYTNLEGMKAILSSQFIKASTKKHRDAAFGTGVYLTKLDPNTSNQVLIKNNWDDGPAIINNPSINARTDFVIRIPTKHIPGVVSVVDDDDRDVWLYPKDFLLNNTDVEVYQRNLIEDKNLPHSSP